MAQQYARDEAGNTWDISNPDAPVFVAAAEGGAGGVVAPNPVQAQRQSVDLTGAGLGNQKTAQQIALEAARAPAEIQRAQLEVESTRLANEKAKRELANPVETKQAQTDRLSRLMQLANQIGRTQTLYNTGIGTTKGLAGIQDYAPTDANSRFDVAGAALSQQGLATFKVPGSGQISDRDSIMFDRANLPTAGTRDAAVEEQLRGIRSRVDEELKALGRAPLDWASIERQQSDDKPAAIIPGAPTVGGGNTPTGNGPAGYDVATTSGIQGGGGGGGQFASAAGVAMAKRLKDAYNKGADVQSLNRLLVDNGFQPFADAASISAIQKRGPINFAPPQVDDTRGAVGRALGSVADSAGGAYAISAADALTAGNLDSLAGGQSALAMEYARQQNPGASLLGTVTGGALAAGGAELGLARAGLGAGAAALGGDALYGAAYGAGSADGEGQSRLMGAAVGGLGGLGGGVAGRAVARGVGGLATGIQNADVQLLRGRNVPLTVGQAVSQSGRVGGAIKTLEDLSTGLPGIGTMTNARRLEGFEGFNRAGFDEALQGINADTGGIIREQGIDIAQDRVGDAFDQALDGVNVRADQPFVGDMRGAVQAGQALPEPMRGNAAYTLPTRVGNSFSEDGGLTGNGFQQSMRGLRQDAATLRNEPYGQDFGNVTRQAEGALEGLLTRQAPDVLPAYQAANGAYRNVEILRDAVNRARVGTRVGEPGVYAPSQLADAAAANSKRFGKFAGNDSPALF